MVRGDDMAHAAAPPLRCAPACIADAARTGTSHLSRVARCVCNLVRACAAQACAARVHARQA